MTFICVLAIIFTLHGPLPSLFSTFAVPNQATATRFQPPPSFPPSLCSYFPPSCSTPFLLFDLLLGLLLHGLNGRGLGSDVVPPRRLLVLKREVEGGLEGGKKEGMEGGKEVEG